MNRDRPEPSDEQLAARLAVTDDEVASDELYRRFRRRVYLWCHGYCHDRDEAVDLTQEVFIKVFTHVGAFDRRARFATWVYAIARNHCLGRLSRQGTKWRRRLATLEGFDVEDQRCTEELRQAELQGSLERVLQRARSRMKNDELEAFVLHYRDGLTVNEITQTLGCTNATGARTLIQNARRKFRRLTAGGRDA
jgi:RNA polymerase sigma-70 factor (ECF subfamily)